MIGAPFGSIRRVGHPNQRFAQDLTVRLGLIREARARDATGVHEKRDCDVVQTWCIPRFPFTLRRAIGNELHVPHRSAHVGAQGHVRAEIEHRVPVGRDDRVPGRDLNPIERVLIDCR